MRFIVFDNEAVQALTDHRHAKPASSNRSTRGRLGSRPSEDPMGTFPDADGGFANRRWFQRVWARAARDAGWAMKRPTAAVWHPHDLRHVAAWRLLFDVGLDPAVVATLLGHTNAAFTLRRYVGVRGDLGATVTAGHRGLVNAALAASAIRAERAAPP